MRSGVLLLFVAGVGLVVSALLVPPPNRRTRREGPFRRALAQAGLDWPPGVLASLSVSSAVVAAAVAVAVTGGLVATGVLAGLAALPLPVWAVVRRAASRRRALIDAWPDAIDVLVGAVRSGDSLASALATAAQSGPLPLRPALAQAAAASRASGDFAGALAALAHGLADPVSRQVAAMLTLAHEVGGRDLTAVLRDLSLFVREERALRRELDARAAWTLAAARVAAAGPWAVLVLLAAQGGTRDAFAGAAGSTVLVVGAVMCVLGYRLMLVVGRLPRVGEGVP